MPKREEDIMKISIENSWQNYDSIEVRIEVCGESLPGFFTGCKKHVQKGRAPGRVAGDGRKRCLA
jgi:ribosomal protein L31